jgi:hypothetical protein
MNATNFHQQQRSQALEWWNALSMKEKTSLAKGYYPDRNLFTLTGREIEKIFKLVTHG